MGFLGIFGMCRVRVELLLSCGGGGGEGGAEGGRWYDVIVLFSVCVVLK